MSTFTSILQQRINALQNQIRNLQEQNNNLRRRARYLMEAAASTDVSMLSTDPQAPSQGPLGLYGKNQDRYTATTQPPPFTLNNDQDGDGVLDWNDPDFLFIPGLTPNGKYGPQPDGSTYVLNGNKLTVTTRDGTTYTLIWDSNTNSWRPEHMFA